MKSYRLLFVALVLGAFTGQSIQAQMLYKEKQKGEFTSIDKAVSICTGVFLGAFAGGIIGSLIGDSQAYVVCLQSDISVGE